MKKTTLLLSAAIAILGALSANAALPPFEQSKKEIDAVLDLVVKQNLAGGEITSLVHYDNRYVTVVGKCQLTAEVHLAPSSTGAPGADEVSAQVVGYNCVKDKE